jgi:hypothetical protein
MAATQDEADELLALWRSGDIGAAIGLAQVIQVRTLSEKMQDTMSGKRKIAYYLLTPVFEREAEDMTLASAAVVSCLATGEYLSGSGSPGIGLSSGVVKGLRDGVATPELMALEKRIDTILSDADDFGALVDNLTEQMFRHELSEIYVLGEGADLLIERAKREQTQEWLRTRYYALSACVYLRSMGKLAK